MPVIWGSHLAIDGKDLFVATHGHGLWVVDHSSARRQLSDSVVRGDAYLLKPSDTVNLVEGTDNGTPLQKDEPQSENPPNGVMIDYYLKKPASTPVVIEIIDAGGTVVQKFSSDGSAVQVSRTGPQEVTVQAPEHQYQALRGVYEL